MATRTIEASPVRKLKIPGVEPVDLVVVAPCEPQRQSRDTRGARVPFHLATPVREQNGKEPSYEVKPNTYFFNNAWHSDSEKVD